MIKGTGFGYRLFLLGISTHLDTLDLREKDGLSDEEIYGYIDYMMETMIIEYGGVIVE